MNRIDIFHNPFIVDTQFLINDELPARGCKLSSYKEARLQGWIEKLFDDLKQLFNGDEQYEIVFTGVESDYLDLEAAAAIAIERGAHVTLAWNAVDSSEKRLDAIRALKAEAEGHPRFKPFFNTDSAKQSFEEAFNRDFDVYVVATMSSGKSTLINAMLGRDLLPFGNEATTATITTIADNESIGERFSAKRTGSQNQVLDSVDEAELEHIQVWNKQSDTYRIEVEGNIKGIRERVNVRLVLTDTPGPNNSEDDNHQRTMMRYIQDSTRNPLILYVLNATQLRTNDDKDLLRVIAQTMNKGGKQNRDRFIFVINKMDAFDPEREDIPAVLKRVKEYLIENDIHSPLIFPVSANLMRVMRLPSDQLSKSDRRFLNEKAPLFEEEPSMNMSQYMPITSRVKRNLESRKLPPLMLMSGLPAVESSIDEYIDKYNFPHRVKRAYDAMMRAFESGVNEADVNRQLALDEQSLRMLEKQVEILRARTKQGFESTAFRENMSREGLNLPQKVQATLEELDAHARATLRELAEGFRGFVTIARAESQITAAEKSLRSEFNMLINAYENQFEESQAWISHRLHQEYQCHVRDIFADCDALNLPLLDSLLTQASKITVDLTIKKGEVQTVQTVVDTKLVGDSTWYKPWTYLRKRSVSTYKSEDKVKLETFWGERQTTIDADFDELAANARGRVEEMKDLLTNQFLDNMRLEFDTRFLAMLTDLEEKLAERKKREEAIEQAVAFKATILKFKAQLEKTLTVCPGALHGN